MRKILFTGIELTSQRVRRLRKVTSELPGRPVWNNNEESIAHSKNIVVSCTLVGTSSTSEKSTTGTEHNTSYIFQL